MRRHWFERSKTPVDPGTEIDGVKNGSEPRDGEGSGCAGSAGRVVDAASMDRAPNSWELAHDAAVGRERSAAASTFDRRREWVSMREKLMLFEGEEIRP